MKIRATNEALGQLAANLVSNPISIDFDFLDQLDDVSVQTLHTLVSQCPYCGDWTRLEDGDCTCSHSEQQKFDIPSYYVEDPIFETNQAWIDGLEEPPEE